MSWVAAATRGPVRKHDLSCSCIAWFQSTLIDVLADLMQPALREDEFETEKR